MTDQNPARPPEEILAAMDARDGAATERGVFIMRVYGHLMGAIAAFILIETWLFKSGYAESIAVKLMGVNWMLILGGFMVAGWLARGLASRSGGLGTQYLGLALYVAAQAVIFVPFSRHEGAVAGAPQYLGEGHRMPAVHLLRIQTGQ